MRPYLQSLLASVAAALAIPNNPTEAAQQVTFHFVPGAFHGPWAFDLIRAELASRGFNKTSASTLPSVGNADPDVGLYADAAAVVLVVHSYGGAVSSNAVEGLSVQQRTAAGRRGGIISHIFLTALALRVGQTALDAFGGTISADWNVTDDGKFFSSSDPAPIFYNDVQNQTLVAQAVAALRPEPVKTLQQPSRYAPWTESFNVAFIHTSLDRAINISTQNAVSSQFPAGSFMATINTGHSPFLSQPKELADNLIAAYQHVISC
ncbi:hypothetical protein C8A03DRAFT_19516 [Achaetomium macrosporum]|uniref:AB hydrolase-1 domain-containing protein n=1 Tax=Achaetomium macrosporum TaxID=79813 RepID=A0AAN7H6V5_9PEZI|nr:hypothetical protein C8A03DRAFT_19516 [Achaetomium macrosporum]